MVVAEQHHGQSRTSAFQLSERHPGDREFGRVHQGQDRWRRRQVVERATQPHHEIDADASGAGLGDLAANVAGVGLGVADEHVEDADVVATRGEASPRSRQVDDMGSHGGVASTSGP